MSWSLAAIVVCIAGGLTLLVIGIGFLWLYILRCNWISKKTSESGSSDPSTQVEWNRAGQIPSTGCVATLSEHRRARRFSLEELLQATKNFDESKLVGVGSFGLVYKGLLLDGTVVAIKRRQQASKLEFVEEVNTLSAIYHRNLVTLIGYCQEGGLQMLVYEYLPNRSISSHLCGKY
ncbi:putative receptor-like protein kinase [Apostasia shenzhenica]|uniref:non-specific serine/threonine protein kinase n=1 Tax=Apostasia shenzhenica TaxID=1088818 RepID=A0A2I0AQ15_9ASPA|nr:putative receptor-like protein kinase [Apostasia shenzhenica]